MFKPADYNFYFTAFLLLKTLAVPKFNTCQSCPCLKLKMEVTKNYDFFPENEGQNICYLLLLFYIEKQINILHRKARVFFFEGDWEKGSSV